MKTLLIVKIVLAFFVILLVLSPVIFLWLLKLSDKKAEKLSVVELKKFGFKFIKHQKTNDSYCIYFKDKDGKKYNTKYLFPFLKGPIKWIENSPQEIAGGANNDCECSN